MRLVLSVVTFDEKECEKWWWDEDYNQELKKWTRLSVLMKM